jgi:hypothetical protein
METVMENYEKKYNIGYDIIYHQNNQLYKEDSSLEREKRKIFIKYLLE